MTDKEKFRTESDLLGAKQVPEEALYGVQTTRAMENFHISGRLLSSYPKFITGMAITKKAAAMANMQVGMITEKQGEAIIWACDQLIAGKYHDQFPIDMIQGGAGTSTNMAANEVIANLALEHMGYQRGQYEYCSPNDVVNASQSTNDAYPCAIHMALALEHLAFMPHLEQLIEALDKKSQEFAHVIKMGRTQLQDAVPMTLGQTFGAFAEILPGIDGLIHISQIADRRIGKPEDVLSEGQDVKVKITDVDAENKRISLSIRALLEQAAEDAE